MLDIPIVVTPGPPSTRIPHQLANSLTQPAEIRFRVVHIIWVVLRRAKPRIIRPTPPRIVASMSRAVVTMTMQTGAMTSVALTEAIEAVIAGLALSSTANMDTFRVFHLAELFPDRGFAVFSSLLFVCVVRLCRPYATTSAGGRSTLEVFLPSHVFLFPSFIGLLSDWTSPIFLSSVGWRPGTTRIVGRDGGEWCSGHRGLKLFLE
jgi:hypothetical protein